MPGVIQFVIAKRFLFFFLRATEPEDDHAFPNAWMDVFSAPSRKMSYTCISKQSLGSHGCAEMEIVKGGPRRFSCSRTTVRDLEPLVTIKSFPHKVAVTLLVFVGFRTPASPEMCFISFVLSN